MRTGLAEPICLHTFGPFRFPDMLLSLLSFDARSVRCPKGRFAPSPSALRAVSLVRRRGARRVFTAGPAPANPYTMLFFKVLPRLYRKWRHFTSMWYNPAMNKKDAPHTLSVRFTKDEKAIMAALRTFYGLSSDNETLRFALRAALREMEQARAKATHA